MCISIKTHTIIHKVSKLNLQIVFTQYSCPGVLSRDSHFLPAAGLETFFLLSSVTPAALIPILPLLV